MPIEYPEGAPKLPEPRIEKALDYFSTYQSTLRKAFEDLSDEAKSSLAGLPNPHLATGPMDIIVCTNGVFAAIRNSLESGDIKATVTFPDVPEMTVIEYFNSVVEKVFTFMDPISKLSAKGNWAKFQDSSVYDGLLAALLIADRGDRLWYPPATKVFLIGWNFFEVGDFRAKAQEAAQQSLTLAHGLVNLRYRLERQGNCWEPIERCWRLQRVKVHCKCFFRIIPNLCIPNMIPLFRSRP